MGQCIINLLDCDKNFGGSKSCETFRSLMYLCLYCINLFLWRLAVPREEWEMPRNVCVGQARVRVGWEIG